MRSLARVGAALLVTCFVVTAQGAGNTFTEVSAKELVAAPQLYWAQGIVFRDTLTKAPSDSSTSLGGRRVYRISTEVIGPCYADSVLLPALRDIKPGTSCLFVGTVYQDRGWFSSKFHVVIQQVTASIQSLPDMGPRLIALQQTTSNQIYATTAARLESLLQGIHAELLAYAASSNVTLEAVLDPESLHKERVRQSVRSGINRLETDLRAPSSTFFNDLVTAMIAQQYVVPSTPKGPKPAAAVSNEAPHVTEAPKAAVIEKNVAPVKAVEAEPVAPVAKPVEVIKTQPEAEKPVAPVAKKHEPRQPDQPARSEKKSDKPKPVVEKKTETPAPPRATANVTTNTPAAKPKTEKKSETSGSFFSWLFGSADTNAPKKTVASSNQTGVITNKPVAVPSRETETAVSLKPAKEKAAAPSPAPEPRKADAKSVELTKKADKPQAAREPKKQSGSFWSTLFGGSTSTNAPKTTVATNTPAAKVEPAPPAAKPASGDSNDQAVPLR